MKRLVNHFLQGLLYTAPIGITAYIIYKSFVFIDDIFCQDNRHNYPCQRHYYRNSVCIIK